MGRTTGSCLKIITCGGDSAADEDLDLASSDSKASSDKRRWSFRKRSDRHRVLSNTVISEPVSVGYNKESPEATTDNFHSPKILSVPEKAPIEEPPLSSAVVSSEVVDLQVTERNTTSSDHKVEVSVAIVIQAATRGYLARRELLKLKNVVKLQAAVRGHLVRRQAIGTLRCVQAIIKMQALVRARHARQHVKESAAKDDEKIRMDTERSMPLGNEISSIKPNKTYSPTGKLLSNRFARQLLESTSKTKHIPIKCDPSRSDSAWKWLERWMAVTSSDKGQRQEQSFNQGYEEHEENTKQAAYGASNEVPVADISISSESKLAPSESALPTEGEGNSIQAAYGASNEVPVADISISSESKLAPSESALPTEGEGNSIAKDSVDLELQPAVSVPDDCISSLAKKDQDQSHLENEVLGMPPENNAYIERVAEKTSYSLSGQIPLQFNATVQLVPNSVSDKPESDDNNPKRTIKWASCEPLENEGKKLVFGSRKPRNPAFAAAQSKFEELTSATSVGRSSDSPIPQVDSLRNAKDLSSVENSITHDPRNQIAASECGTEISISSTLNSPDRSEADGEEIVLEIGSLEKGKYVINCGADNVSTLVNMNVESRNGLQTNVEANNSSLDSEVLKSHRLEDGDGNLTNSIVATDALQFEQQIEEPTTSDVQTQNENSTDPQVYRSSPEGTPRSHTTALESHGTPSSQVSVIAKKGKKDGNMPTRKQRAQLVGKRSPSNPNNDSGGRSSTENLPKDSKTAKKRNSFGMAKPDHVDHEPRISSSNSLPSYMQATESARAKAYANISPKSSPDVHDKDNYTKKRHSLPIANGKQGSSPRMQRSASQAQQNSKANDTHSPHNSAERRWQR